MHRRRSKEKLLSKSWILLRNGGRDRVRYETTTPKNRVKGVKGALAYLPLFSQSSRISFRIPEEDRVEQFLRFFDRSDLDDK